MQKRSCNLNNWLYLLCAEKWRRGQMRKGKQVFPAEQRKGNLTEIIKSRNLLKCEILSFFEFLFTQIHKKKRGGGFLCHITTQINDFSMLNKLSNYWKFRQKIVWKITFTSKGHFLHLTKDPLTKNYQYFPVSFKIKKPQVVIQFTLPYYENEW